MKKILKIISGIFLSVFVFSSLLVLNFNDNDKNVENNTLDQFYESTDNLDEVFGEMEGIDLKVKSVYSSDTLINPTVKVQISSIEENFSRSIRFVAAIPDLNISAKFVRTMYDENGDIYKETKEYEVSEAYTSIISGDSRVTPDSFGEGYNYFVTYTMANIPSNYWYYILDVSLEISAITEDDTKLTSTGDKKANIEGLMEDEYLNTYKYTLKSDDTYEISVLNTAKELDKYYIGGYVNTYEGNVAIKAKPVTSTGMFSFAGIKATSICVPETLTKFEDYTFIGSYNIENVYYNGDINSWLNIDFSNWGNHPFFEAIANNEKERNLYINNVLVEEITLSTESSFNGSYSLLGCTSLTSVIISEGITSINIGTFKDCINLVNVSLPESLSSIGSSVFEGCTKLSNISLPINLTNIGSSAFKGCSSLTEIILPINLLSIEEYAFEDCESLENIYIPDSVIYIGTGAFIGGFNLKNIYYSGDIMSWCNISSGYFNFDDVMQEQTGNFGKEMNLYINDELVVDLIIPEEIIDVVNFSGCISLRSVVISEGVRNIGYGAFFGCINLSNVIIPESVEIIDSYAFAECVNISNISLPSSLKELGNKCFSGCIVLSSIIVPDTITSIGRDAFSGCLSMVKVTLPFIGFKLNLPDEYLYSIHAAGSFAFLFGDEVPSTLKEVVITKSEKIWYGAFANCNNIEKIILPSTLQRVASAAFYNCNSLKEVRYNGDIESWCSICFEDNPLINGGDLYINNEIIKDLIIPEGVISICQGAFYGYVGLTSVQLPNTLIDIGYSAFEGCIGLTSIIIPESVENIYYGAFAGCDNLIIYTYAESDLEGWLSGWNGCATVVYGYIKEDDPSVSWGELS